MSDAISVALVSDRQSPLGHPGVDVQVICAANISAFVDIPATMQIMDPAGRVLATETYNFSSIYTIKALISSFRDEYAGNYTCTFTVTTPALQSITKTETTHIYIGEMIHTFSIDRANITVTVCPVTVNSLALHHVKLGLLVLHWTYMLLSS